MDVNPKIIEAVYSAKSEPLSESKSPAKPCRKAVRAKRRLIGLVSVSIRLCAIICSTNPTSQITIRGDRADSARIHMMRVRNLSSLLIVTMPMTLHGVIVAVAIQVFAAIVVP